MAQWRVLDWDVPPLALIPTTGRKKIRQEIITLKYAGDQERARRIE